LSNIIWHPDSCDCILEIEPSPLKWAKSLRWCKLHQGTRGQAHLDTIMLHRVAFKDNPANDLPIEFIKEAKANEFSPRQWAAIQNRQDLISKMDSAENIIKARHDEQKRIREL
jgi:hypothetical protein